MNRLLTNCPNCGAPLRADGYCEYCNTKVRYANEVELSNLDDIFRPSEVEIVFKVVKDKDLVILIPFKGIVSSVTQLYDEETFYADNLSIPISVRLEPEIEITLNGRIDKNIINPKED